MNSQESGNSDKDTTDENNNQMDDNDLFITQSTYTNEVNYSAFDIGVDEMLMFPVSPLTDEHVNEEKICNDNENDESARPKRKMKARRNSIYEYFLPLKKSKY